MTTRSLRRLPRSFLLRVAVEHGERRHRLQDLRSGEREEFAGQAGLRRSLAAQRPARLR